MITSKIDHDKLHMQETEYNQPVHWKLGKVDRDRYMALSRLIADTIRSLPEIYQKQMVNVIDLGCGDGAGTWQVFDLLKTKGISVKIQGSDYSETAINWAKEMTKDLGCKDLEFSVAGAEGIVGRELSGYPLVVVMREVIEHLTEDQFAETIKGLRAAYESGYLLITTPTVNSPTDAKHYRHYDRNLISQWFRDNALIEKGIFGFAFRPKALYKPLARLKSALNRKPVLWRFMSPLWRKVPLELAQTVVAVGSWSQETSRNE